MSEKINTLELDDVVYHFSEADVFKAKKNAEMLMSLARGALKIKGKGEGQSGFDVDIDPAEILANLSSSEADKIQEFIWSTVMVVKNGEGVKFSSQADRSIHLGQYRSHVYPIIIFGAKFHFLDFLPTGGEFAKSIFGQAVNKMVANLK
jgi:Protein of unknown function (DUF2669).